MKTRSFARAARCGALISTLVAANCLPLGTAAYASSVSTAPMPASQSAVACLTPQLCVVVGRDSSGMGDIIDVVNGTPGKPVEVKGSSALVAISCPADVGCMVLGRAAGTEAPLLVQLNDKGQPVTVQKGVIASTAPQVPRGVSLVSISCRSLSDCGLLGTGTDNPTRSFEYAQWDGLSMHVARTPAGRFEPPHRSIAVLLYPLRRGRLGDEFQGRSGIGLLDLWVPRLLAGHRTGG